MLECDNENIMIDRLIDRYIWIYRINIENMWI